MFRGLAKDPYKSQSREGRNKIQNCSLSGVLEEFSSMAVTNLCGSFTKKSKTQALANHRQHLAEREIQSVALSRSPKLESKWPYLQNNGDKNDEDENGNHD